MLGFRTIDQVIRQGIRQGIRDRGSRRQWLAVGCLVLGLGLMVGGAGCQFDPGGADYGASDSPDAASDSPDAAATSTPDAIFDPPTASPPDAACEQGACVCAPPLVHCGASGCVDRATDRDNCGVCGTVCSADETCADGDCERFRVRDQCDACPCDDCNDDEECGEHFDGSGRIICIEDD
jgi:hypothetical protein